MSGDKKLPLFALLAFGLTCLIVRISVLPWLFVRSDVQNAWWLPIAAVSGVIWMGVLAWAIHHLVYQIASLIKVEDTLPRAEIRPRFLIVCPTRDDFQNAHGETFICQEYPENFFKVVLCDDSEQEIFRKTIDDFVAAAAFFSQ